MEKVVDKNLILATVTEKDVCWYNPQKAPFSIHGVFFDEKREIYTRMPNEKSKAVSELIEYLVDFTAGGRIRFSTNSKYVALKCTNKKCFDIMTQMPISGEYGFSIYVDGKFKHFIAPCESEIINRKNNLICFDGILYLDGNTHDIEVYFPLYHCVKEVLVGLKDGCSVTAHKPYQTTKPVVFYGSSITQGGCASHSGNDYISLLSRWLDTDVINLGFSGNAKGETAMAEYIASLDASVFVIDYDHNAPTNEHLQSTHFPFYQTIRVKNPNTPILFLSMPPHQRPDKDILGRIEIIKNTYLKSIELGDKKTAFINGQTLFGNEDIDCCTVDACHPNDLGFYKMAKTISPVLSKLLKNN